MFKSFCLLLISIIILLFCANCSRPNKPDSSEISTPPSISAFAVTTATTSVQESFFYLTESEKSLGTQKYLSQEIEDQYFKDLTTAFSGNNQKTVWAYVNKIPIYKSDVLSFKAGRDMTIRQSLKNLNTQEEKNEYLRKYDKDESGVLQVHIEMEILAQEGEKLGYTYNENDIIKSVKANHENNLKVDKTFVEKTLKAQNCTEEEYLNSIIKKKQRTTLANQLMEKVHPYNSNDAEGVRDAAIAKHVASIKKNYHIQILKK